MLNTSELFYRDNKDMVSNSQWCPQKCDVFKKKVHVLGWIVFKEGYTMHPEEIAPVQALRDKTIHSGGRWE